jgi:hypothetical protein
MPKIPDLGKKAKNLLARRKAKALYRKYIEGKATGGDLDRFLTELEKDTSIYTNTYKAAVTAFAEARKIREETRGGAREERARAPPPPPPPPPRSAPRRRPQRRRRPRDIREAEEERERLERIEEEERLRTRTREEERLRRRERERFREEIEEAEEAREAEEEARREELKALKPLTERTGLRFKSNIYLMIGFVIAGIAVYFILGWAFLPLIIALSGFIPFYIVLPSEGDIRRSLPEGETIPTGYMIVLLFKSGAKLFAIGLIAYNFILINPLIGLILVFYYYFSLPVSYKTSKPHKLVEAWVRPGVGAYLAVLLMITFRGTIASAAFTWLTLAFFVTLPKHKEAEEDETRVKNRVSIYLKGLSEKYTTWKYFDKILFLILAGVGGFLFLVGIRFNPFQAAPHETIFLVFWIIFTIGGLLTGPEARPFMGIIMIAISIFMFSFAYGGIVGRAIFGYWWPQVEAFGETIITPMTEGIGMATSSLGDVLLLLTNPAEYYRRQMELTQVRATRVMEGGTYKSIELSAFDLNPSTPGILEPTEPLLGVVDLENQGEFNANYIKLGIDTTWRKTEDPTGTSRQAGTLSKITCSGQGDIDTNTCTWGRITHPGDIKEVTFIFDKDEWDGELKECENEDGDCISCSATDCPGATYANANTNVKINAQVNYTYNVNVSMPVEIIDQSLYERLLIAREIRLEQLESVYSGGPVKATIWTQKQPLRNGEESLVKVFIYNEGGGSLDFVNYTIYVHPNLATGTLELATSNLNGCDVDVDKDFSILPSTDPTFPDYQYKVCTHDEPIEKGKYKLVSFYINSTIGTNIDRRTFSIVGLVNYDYSKTRTQILTLANNPPGATGD